MSPVKPWLVYEQHAASYDACYDQPEGAALFVAAELAAVQPLAAPLLAPGLEVGVGTGRFAAALGLAYGLDPAVPELQIARDRGITVAAGVAEALPFRDACFGAVIFVVTLSFVADPKAALREARRVLRPNGALVLADVPLDSLRGRHYAGLGSQGHPYYSNARFYNRGELVGLCGQAGLSVIRQRSALFGPPDLPPSTPDAREGSFEGAGFQALLAVTG